MLHVCLLSMVIEVILLVGNFECLILQFLTNEVCMRRFTHLLNSCAINQASPA